jgi:hypothetical protein
LVATTTGVGASATVTTTASVHARTTVDEVFLRARPNKFDPNSKVPMGLHCGSGHMSD